MKFCAKLSAKQLFLSSNGMKPERPGAAIGSAPQIHTVGLCGLSGVAHGLMAVSALEMMQTKDDKKPSGRAPFHFCSSQQKRIWKPLPAKSFSPTCILEIWEQRLPFAMQAEFLAPSWFSVRNKPLSGCSIGPCRVLLQNFFCDEQSGFLELLALLTIDS